MTIEALYNMAEQYTNFSCKPKSNKYKVGTVLDEDIQVLVYPPLKPSLSVSMAIFTLY